MAKIIESIPNISEGRNKEVIEACVDQIEAHRAAHFLTTHQIQATTEQL